MPRPIGEPPPLTLYGCWEVCARMGDPPHIVRQIDLLEDAVTTSPGLALDAAKSLIESVCKTILDARAVTYEAERVKLNEIVRLTLTSVRLVGEGLPETLSRSMEALGGGLVTVAQRLGELRNKGGLIGHGRAAHERFVESTHALYAARAADALVHLLYVAHESEEEGLANAGPSYGNFDAFDQETDALHPVTIYGLDFRASEILYRLDNIAYLEQNAVFETQRALDAEAEAALAAMERMLEADALDGALRAEADQEVARAEAMMEAAMAAEEAERVDAAVEAAMVHEATGGYDPTVPDDTTLPPTETEPT